MSKKKRKPLKVRGARSAGRRRKAPAPRKPRAPKVIRKKKAQRPLAVTRLPGDESILALDVSSKCVGWSIFINGHLIEHGRYVQVGESHGERLARFRLWILAILTEWSPTYLVYEAPYQGRMRNTYGILSRYAGVVELCNYDHYGQPMPPANAVPAHMVKKAIGAKKGKDHEENKRIVLRMINDTFGLALKFTENDTTKKTSQDDEADAIALNWAWHILYRGEEEPVSE
jgi:Holliday junction resolvasome RuvABC endonuclease subunit